MYFVYLSPRMMKALALLLEELSAHESSHFDLIAGLSGLVLEGLKHSCQPDLDTVEVKIMHTRLKSALRARPRCARMDSTSGLTSSTPMVRTHTLDPTPDAPRS